MKKSAEAWKKFDLLKQTVAFWVGKDASHRSFNVQKVYEDEPGFANNVYSIDSGRFVGSCLHMTKDIYGNI